MAKKKLRKAVKKAAKNGNISRKEMKQIMKIAPTAAKAVNQIAKSGATVRTSAANYAVQQARAQPTVPRKPNKPVLGTSKLGKTLGSMAAVPGYKPTGTGQNLFIKGQKLDSKGRVVTGQPVKKVVNQVTPDPNANVEPETEETPVNPYQDVIDTLTNKITDLEDTIATNDQYMQDYINQITQDAQLQAQQMSEMFNAQLADQEARYQQSVQQADLLAQQEREAARAFMINQGRMVNPANLQIGATYGTPQLAGTQGFKYRPQRTTTTTPAEVASAFTAPTLAAAAMTPQQQLQPTVLNV